MQFEGGSGKICDGNITGDFNLLQLVGDKTYVHQVCVAKLACVSGPFVQNDVAVF